MPVTGPKDSNPATGGGDAARIQAFFGRHAEGYRRSPSHRAGSDLERLLQLVRPEPHHRLLDVATAAGHTALTFAPHVAEVVGLDLTPAMQAAFEREAAERGVANARFVLGDVHSLPFDDGSFDLVTCRRAAHHFGYVERAVAEMVRVLRPGGRLGVVDMTAPETVEGATLFNDLERLRDDSHNAALDPRAWQDLLRGLGLRVLHLEIHEEALTPESWLYPVPASPDLLRRLEERLAREPAVVRRQVVIEENGRWWLRKRRLVAVAGRP